MEGNHKESGNWGRAELATWGQIGTFRRPPRFSLVKQFALLIAVSLVAACADREAGPEASLSVVPTSDETGPATAPSSSALSSKSFDRADLVARLDAIDAAIDEWRGARTLAGAKAG